MKTKLSKTGLADLICCIVLVGIGIGTSIFIYLPMTASGSTVQVRSNGEVIQSYPLSENYTGSIETTYGTNTILIENNTAYMSDANCPDQACVSMHGISNMGETIVCLPHRLVLEVVPNDTNRDSDTGLDAVTGGVR